MAKSFKNLFPQVCSLENVMAAARSAMREKMSGQAAARFHARWDTDAVRLHEELSTGTWQPGNYTYFDIHEPKLRRVAAAPFWDRVVHHALVRVLEPIFEKKFIEDSYACRKGKGALGTTTRTTCAPRTATTMTPRTRTTTWGSESPGP
ncbi:MAG: hypothetical protein WEB53_17695 [Akkermansiaceae bacterium]